MRTLLIVDMIAGANFSAYSDPSLAVFEQNYVATLPFDDYNACLVNDDKYDWPCTVMVKSRFLPA